MTGGLQEACPRLGTTRFPPHLIAPTARHEAAAAYRLDRFATGARVDGRKKAPAASTTCTEGPARSCKSPCPICGNRDTPREFHGPKGVTQTGYLDRPAEDAPAGGAWHDYLHLARQPLRGETRGGLLVSMARAAVCVGAGFVERNTKEWGDRIAVTGRPGAGAGEGAQPGAGLDGARADRPGHARSPSSSRGRSVTDYKWRTRSPRPFSGQRLRAMGRSFQVSPPPRCAEPAPGYEEETQTTPLVPQVVAPAPPMTPNTRATVHARFVDGNDRCRSGRPHRPRVDRDLVVDQRCALAPFLSPWLFTQDLSLWPVRPRRAFWEKLYRAR